MSFLPQNGKKRQKKTRSHLLSPSPASRYPEIPSMATPSSTTVTPPFAMSGGLVEM